MSFAQGHALLIGVGRYAHWSQLNVDLVQADAEKLRDVLCDPHFCGYPTEQVTLLCNEKANRTTIVSALETLATRVGPDDTVTLFYAGHGIYGADGDYYLTTHDCRFIDKKVEPGTGLRDADFLAHLRAIKAKRLLLLVNACYAGTIGPTLGEAEPELDFLSAGLPPAATAAILATSEGRIIITAARAHQKALVGAGPLTVFAQALVGGLSGAGAVTSNRGYISAFALYEHIFEQVHKVASRVNHQQEPELTVLKGIGPFPVALYRGATTLGTFDDDEPLPTDMAATPVDRTTADRMWRRYGRNMTAINTGDGAIAQGENAVAAGERGVAIRGDVKDSPIVTGDNNTIQQARGRNIAQAGPGGSSTVNDHSRRTAFDQRNQTVLGGQTNIEGGVHTSGGTLNTGLMTTGGLPAQVDILSELRKLLAQITQAGQQGLLDDITTIDAESALKKAIALAGKPVPDRQAILAHLTTAQVTISAATYDVVGIGNLTTAIANIVVLVRQSIP